MPQPPPGLVEIFRFVRLLSSILAISSSFTPAERFTRSTPSLSTYLRTSPRLSSDLDPFHRGDLRLYPFGTARENSEHCRIRKYRKGRDGCNKSWKFSQTLFSSCENPFHIEFVMYCRDRESLHSVRVEIDTSSEHQVA